MARRFGALVPRHVARGVTGAALTVSLACSAGTPAESPSDRASAPSTAEGSQPTTANSPTALLDALSETQGSRAAALARPVDTPLAQSTQIEERRVASDASLTKELGRVGFEASAVTQRLPPVADEIRHVRIGWYINHALDGLRTAIDRSLAFVLVIGEGSCDYCLNLATDSLRCPAVERFAGDAVFAFSLVTDDNAARNIAEALKVAAYPTMTIIEPESSILLERGRINGYFDASMLGGYLNLVLWKTPPRVLPGSENRRALAMGVPGTETGAVLEFWKRGLKHTLPAPTCR